MDRLYKFDAKTFVNSVYELVKQLPAEYFTVCEKEVFMKTLIE